MKDNVFIDTNVLVYAKLQDEKNADKRAAAVTAIENLPGLPVVSVQVLNEFSSSLLKHKVPPDLILQAVREIAKESLVIPIDLDLVWETWHIMEKYHFSYWDSMIIAAALRGNCSTLYTEDMQHGQTIETRLEVVNPFIPRP